MLSQISEQLQKGKAKVVKQLVQEALDAGTSAQEIRELLEAPFREIPMKTTYYDNDVRLFSHLHWTLRHRMEGEESVICLKTPGNVSHSRNEWQVSAPAMDQEAVRSLVAQGAPHEVAEFFEHTAFVPICGAQFLRRCAMLTFSDGSRAEIAIDKGQVFGPKGTLPILELELELYQGAPDEMTRFSRLLCSTYGLKEQPYSKFARARSLS